MELMTAPTTSAFLLLSYVVKMKTTFVPSLCISAIWLQVFPAPENPMTKTKHWQIGCADAAGFKLGAVRAVLCGMLKQCPQIAGSSGDACSLLGLDLLICTEDH